MFYINAKIMVTFLEPDSSKPNTLLFTMTSPISDESTVSTDYKLDTYLVSIGQRMIDDGMYYNSAGKKITLADIIKIIPRINTISTNNFTSTITDSVEYIKV